MKSREPIPWPAVDMHSVIGELQHLFAQAHQLGNNDYESGAIQRIIAKVQAGGISPEEGLVQARGIIDSKNER